MNQLDFSTLAGWPGSVETWKFLQDMILQMLPISLLGGSNYIVTGCGTLGGNVGNGVVVVNGEPLPFVGGPVQANVVIVDAVTNRQYFGGAQNPYYHDRIATFGSGAGAVAWSSFSRNDPANGVLARLDRVEKMLQPLVSYQVNGSTVYGSWMFWGRPASEMPAGWEPVPDADWKGKVPVVMDDTDIDFEMLATGGKTGGEKNHRLTNAEIPPKLIDIWEDRKAGSNGVNVLSTADTGNGKLTLQVGGGGQDHNNLQPYKVVMFIRFIG